MAKLSSILIGLLLVGFFAVFFTSFLSSASTEYAVEIDNKSRDSLASFSSRLEQTENKSQNVTAEILSQEQGRDTTDLLGGLFQSGFSATLLAKDSIVFVKTVSTEGADHLDLDEGVKNNFILLIGGIVSIIIIIGIVLSILVRREV